MITPNGICYFGIDATADLTAYVPQLQTAGVSFAVRYYTPPGSPIAGLAPSEARMLSVAGISLLTAWYSNGAARASSFTPQQGYADGLSALAAALALPQPSNSCIFFRVNYTPAPADIIKNIIPYFAGVQAALCINGIPQYRAGVYGNAAVCSALQQTGGGYRLWLSDLPGNNKGCLQNYDIIQSVWQLSYPALNPQGLCALSCPVSTGSNVIASAFTL